MLNVNQLIGFGAGDAAPAGLYRYLMVAAWDPGSGYTAYVNIDWLVGATAYPTVAMTANNAPSPLVAADWQGNATAFQAFDDNNSTYDQIGQTPAKLKIDLGLGNQITPTGIAITVSSVPTGDFPAYIACYGSTTGVFGGEEVVLYPQTAQSGWVTGTPKTITF